jgi:hypothetical protein
MLRSAFLLALCLLAPLSHAQERAVGGSLDTQMTWTALKGLSEQANNNAKAAKVLAEAIATCGKKSMLYAAGQPDADAQGCKAAMPDPSSLNIKTYNESTCVRGGTHTVVATCPGDERLLGCGGGPGDQGESHEYWVLMPDFKNNRCIGYVGNPMCFDSGWSRTIVSAVCYKP